MEPEHIDGGPPPPRITPQDLQPMRRGPVPMEDDSWDVSAVWPSSDVPVGESDRYRGRRRTDRPGRDYRWWIAGAAALIASVATVALIMAPSSGSGASGTWSGPALETADGADTTAGELPIGDGSAPVGLPTGANPNTGLPPFAVTIEAESGSPTVILAGSAVVESDDRASGGQIVTKLGNGGDGTQPGTIQINGISVPSSGTYRISIHYANWDVTGHSSAVVAMTGAEPMTVNFTGSKKCCGVRTIGVTLAAGPHGLTITNATGVAPSIDRIVVSRA